jgi:glutamate racemase
MNTNDFLIGVMDSGFGGLSILEEISSEIPGANFIYYGDLLNSPYGTKSASTVREYVQSIVRFFLGNGTKAILLACNTATSVSVQYLREEHEIPIFGMEPAIKPALIENPDSQIAVLATSLTLKEDKFESLGKTLGAKDKIVPYNCDGLASLIDREDFGEARKFLDPIFSDIASKGIKSIVLGCTHYVLIKPIFKNWNPDIKIYDGNKGTVNHIKNVLKVPEIERETKIEMYLNGGTEEDFEIAYRYLNSANREETNYVK